VVNWTDSHGKNEVMSSFCKFVHFLNTHTYKRSRIIWR
jgi:hypothetical protein